MAPTAFLRLAAAAACAASLALAKTVPQTNVTVATRACQPPYDSFPFCNTSLPMQARVDDIVTRIMALGSDSRTATALTSQLTARHGGGGSPGPDDNITALGLPELDWGTNSIHGVQVACVLDVTTGATVCPTSFANPCTLGATFNKSVFFELGAIIGLEQRALWLAGSVEESSWSGRPHMGLDAWSPNINLMRDPRWGRNQEVPSEDPLVNGYFGQLYTQGLQNSPLDSRYVQVVVVLKHVYGYSLEDSDGFTRYNFDAIISNATLQDTYFPHFRQSIQQANALGIMCSYNAVNGVPSCANSFLMQTVTRDTWGFSGGIFSDSGALEDVYTAHHYVATEQDAACVSIRDGTCDVCSGAVYHDALLPAVAAGKCSSDDVRAALNRTFTLRFQLGLFDPIEDQPLWHVPLSTVNTADAEAFNLLSTLEGMVLLHNDGGVLPLAKGQKLALIGPHANATSALVGNYLGQLCDDDTLNCVPSPFQMISATNNGAGGSTVMQAGCGLTKNDTSGFAAAVAAAQAADAVVLFLGIDDSIEGESNDRTSIDLPYIQHQLAAAVAAVGKPTVIVLFNGGMVDISQEKANSKIGAIIAAGYPGMRGSEAVADTLFGDNDHLGGKLPYTVYPADYVNQIKMSEMEMDVGPGRTYRYYSGPTVYPFGYGISLTTFSMANVSSVPSTVALTAEAAPSRVLSYAVNVTNTGSRTGDEVVFAYMYPQKGTLTSPSVSSSALIKQLVDFQRVHLAPGESQVVTVGVSTATFRMVARPSGHIVSTPGVFTLQLTNGVDLFVNHTVVVEGNEVVVERFPGS